MSIPGFDPNTAGNHEEIEMQFAVKTVEHLEVRSSPRPLAPHSRFSLGLPETPSRAATIKAKAYQSR
jgi:hypothetical protein